MGKPDHSALSGSISNESFDFSLVLGGPLYQLFRRAHLSGDALELLWRRVLVLGLIAWVPLLLLSLAEGNAWGSRVAMPFPKDIETHARFLIALPLLIGAELFINKRLRAVIRQFVERGIVTDASRSKFDAAIASAMRLRDSIIAEVLLIVFVYVTMILVWRTQMSLDVAGWYHVPQDGRLNTLLAGWWLGCVSLPLYQFLMLRWCYRLFIWSRFLWQVSRLELKFVPTHPDRCGGAGFLSLVDTAFAPVVLAQGVVLAGMMANRIFYAGAKLPDFTIELIGIGVGIVLVVLGPLLFFAPKLAEAKRAAIHEYGLLAQRYMSEFDDKWLRRTTGTDETLLGSADVQSLADMGNSFTVVKEMKWVPFTLTDVLQLVLMILLPIAPLLLTMVPLEELLVRLLKVLF